MPKPAYFWFFLLLFPATTLAVNKHFQAFNDPSQEQRYQALIEELRCVVCQNQSLADSNAELAQDLRDEVRRMIIAGHSDGEIMGFLVQRYGNFVLYRPPLEPKTYVLWAGPLLLLLLALLVLAYFIYRHSQNKAQTAPLSEDEQQKMAQIIKDVQS